jgi:hypothetical protein
MMPTEAFKLVVGAMQRSFDCLLFAEGSDVSFDNLEENCEYYGDPALYLLHSFE